MTSVSTSPKGTRLWGQLFKGCDLFEELLGDFSSFGIGMNIQGRSPWTPHMFLPASSKNAPMVEAFIATKVVRATFKQACVPAQS